MSASATRRVLECTLLLALLHWADSAYQIPNVTIQALKPKGLRASIPDEAGISLFVFQANVNSAIAETDVGSISSEILTATNGRWLVYDPDIQLKVDDVINYYVYVSVNGVGYIKDNLSFRVAELEDINSYNPRPAIPTGECRPTETTVHFGVACAGQIILHDEFDTLKEDLWHIEQYIPTDQPDFPFISYQRSAVRVENGILKIRAAPQQQQTGFNSDTIYTGFLDLFNGCSGSTCSVMASGANILPPVLTGKVTTRTSFAFKYGVVEIRAKLPIGDWLYPDILLEPLIKKYGNIDEASGVLKIAAARGNQVLYQSNRGVTYDFNNKLLYGGPIISTRCRDALLVNRINAEGRNWGDDFHVYTLHWSPDEIVLKVDGSEWGRVTPRGDALSGLTPAACRALALPAALRSSNIAPFDHEFYLTLGMSAGGVTDFPDNLKTTNGEFKPWQNTKRKAMFNFWSAIDKWLPTWTQPELQVDYIKVYAL